jgi:DNA-binding NarL/FixJ family response regulator
MLTSSRHEADVVQSYHAGANAYVVKPVDYDKFLSVVEETGAFWSQVNEPLPRNNTRS